MINSTGHNPCGGPKGYCKAKSKGKAIKQVEKKLLDEFAAAEAAGEEPDVDAILERLEAETGVHRAALESLLDVSFITTDLIIAFWIHQTLKCHQLILHASITGRPC
jgi:hypothetical protein